MPDSECMEVPVGVAREISDRFQKGQVVILSYDPRHERMHVTTYGRDPAEKLNAAKIGEACARFLCGEAAEKTVHEDFREVDAAERAAAIDGLVRAATAAEHAIASLLACRSGITDELLGEVRGALAAAIAQGQASFKHT